VTQVQDPALGLVESHTIDLGPLIQSVQIPLQSLPNLKQIDIPTQLGAICKLTDEALNLLIQVIDKGIKQDCPQNQALANTVVTGHQLDLTPFTTTLWAQPASQCFTQ